MHVDWWAAIDSYCERTDASFWSEPLNALSNLSFIVAAVVTWRIAAIHRDRPAQVLAVGVGGIGVGSFLFHTFANVWSLQADVYPIRIFVLAFVGFAVVRFWSGPWWAGLVAAALFVPFSLAVTEWVSARFGHLGGSVGYLPVPVLLVLCAVVLWRQSPTVGRGLLLAAVGFFASLTLRTIDLQVCGLAPIGTHFIWHLLNGAVTGWMILVFVRAREAPPAVYPAQPGRSD
jgi:hypothetical protein